MLPCCLLTLQAVGSSAQSGQRKAVLDDQSRMVAIKMGEVCKALSAVAEFSNASGGSCISEFGAPTSSNVTLCCPSTNTKSANRCTSERIRGVSVEVSTAFMEQGGRFDFI